MRATGQGIPQNGFHLASVIPCVYDLTFPFLLARFPTSTPHNPAIPPSVLYPLSLLSYLLSS